MISPQCDVLLVFIQEGQIGPIHCIRFFSMVWVVMCHLLSIILGVIGLICVHYQLTNIIEGLGIEVHARTFITTFSSLFQFDYY